MFLQRQQAFARKSSPIYSIGVDAMQNSANKRTASTDPIHDDGQAHNLPTPCHGARGSWSLSADIGLGLDYDSHMSWTDLTPYVCTHTAPAGVFATIHLLPSQFYRFNGVLVNRRNTHS